MKTLKEAIQLTLKECLASSSLHGFKYLNCKKLEDRIGWFAILAMSFLMTFFLVENGRDRFLQHPTFIVLGDENLEKEQFMQLSVSICPPTPVSDARARHVVKNMEYLHSFEDGYVAFAVPRLSAILTYEMRGYDKSLRAKAEKPWNGTIGAIFFNCSEIFVRCQMDQMFMNCMDLFQLTVTATGICCTYSPRVARKQTLKGAGNRKHLRFIVQMTSEMLESQILSATNHKILIEEDKAFLGLHASAIHLGLGIENVIDVSNTQYLFSKDLLNMPIESRICSLPQERPNTEWNEQYNHNSCYYDCGTAFLFDQCKCYSLANPFQVADKDICDDTHLDCLIRMRDVLNRDYFDNCNCPRTCTYNDTALDVAILNLDALSSVTDPFYENVNKSTMSVVYVANRWMERSRILFCRPQWKYITDLGGACSLFVGWSVICLIELIYFSSLRLTLNYLKLKRSVTLVRAVT